MVTRAWHVIVFVVAAVGAWLFADLYFRVELPGAATVIHLAFRGAAAGSEWLEGGDGGRPRLVATSVGAALGLAVVLGRFGLVLWRIAGPAVALVQLALICVAALMERGLFFGVLVGGALAVSAADYEERSGRLLRVVRFVGAAVAVGVAGLYLAEVMAARSDGYPIVDWLAEQVAVGRPLGAWYLAGCGGLVLLSAPFLGGQWWAGPVAAAAAVVAGLVLDPGLPLLSAGVVAATGAYVIRATWTSWSVSPRARAWDPATWPARLVPAVAVAGLLVGHTYAVRVFGCGAVAGHPALERVAAPGDVFRVALGRDGAVVALALRSERRIGAYDVDGRAGGLRYARPGPLPALPRDEAEPEPEGTTLASIEELHYAPSVDRFFGTALGGHPDFYSMPDSPSNVVNNLIFELSADVADVTAAVGIEHLCWIGAMAWHDTDRRLYLGCEYEPVLHRYDPATGTVEATLEDPAIGDVAAIAVDPTPGRDRLFVVSFWSSQAVAEVSRTPELRVLQRRDIGGAHYDVAYEPVSDRLFLSSYYGSRVRVLSGSDLSSRKRIATGLGARALAVDSARDLVVASSVYDGLLTVCEASTSDVLSRIRVGGHVKDVVIDSERGEAWFWSQCGLFRLDLDVLLGPR